MSLKSIISRRVFIGKRFVLRRLSDSSGGGDGGNITYSGGQMSVGQGAFKYNDIALYSFTMFQCHLFLGGFYGSGGSRVVGAPSHHPEALARQADVTKLASIMKEIESLESELLKIDSGVSSRAIEIKAKIRKTISNPSVRQLLDRLEIKGEPVWGLSAQERDLVRAAKQKYYAS